MLKPGRSSRNAARAVSSNETPVLSAEGMSLFVLLGLSADNVSGIGAISEGMVFDCFCMYVCTMVSRRL